MVYSLPAVCTQGHAVPICNANLHKPSQYRQDIVLPWQNRHPQSIQPYHTDIMKVAMTVAELRTARF